MTFAANPIAHESIARYLETMKSVYLQVAAGRELTLSRGAAQLQS
ncbi:hypothetical protein [Mycobacterium riyadhense]|nr:hypothetical protein [Mycobacterium riyadhense]